jgi:hypothetical protein
MLIGFLKFGIIDKKASAVLPSEDRLYRHEVASSSIGDQTISFQTIRAGANGRQSTRSRGSWIKSVLNKECRNE